jgi:hypothetical protein
VGGQRATGGAAHQLVDVAVDVAVEGVRGAGRERATDQDGKGQPERGEPGPGQEHRRYGRHEQQLDDPGLGQ